MITSLSWENFQECLEICMLVFYETWGFSIEMCVKSIHSPVAHLHPISLAPNSYHFHFILSPWCSDSIIVHLEEQQFPNKSQSPRLKRHPKGYNKRAKFMKHTERKLKNPLKESPPTQILWTTPSSIQMPTTDCTWKRSFLFPRIYPNHYSQ